MLSGKVKQEISEKIQKILKSVNDNELPDGEINFLLHIDGKKLSSWANIRNNSRKSIAVPTCLIKNEVIV